MSRLNTAINNELKLIALMHDELMLQTHLLKADAKTLWSELERNWSDLQEHLGRATTAGKDAGAEAESAIKSLLDALKSGYKNIRDALKG